MTTAAVDAEDLAATDVVATVTNQDSDAEAAWAERADTDVPPVNSFLLSESHFSSGDNVFVALN